jgi:hypothetical protein
MTILTGEQFNLFSEYLSDKTGHSLAQMETFLKTLENRMEKLKIVSLDDLLIRYKSIDRENYSEQNELLISVAGLFHFNNLRILLKLLSTAE